MIRRGARRPDRPACNTVAVVHARPRPLAARAIGVALTAAVAVVCAGCIGQASRNDDKVDSTSYRPDAREHTLGPTTTGIRPPRLVPGP